MTTTTLGFITGTYNSVVKPPRLGWLVTPSHPRSGQAAGSLLLRILEAAALLLLVYQLYTLGFRVLWPLLQNPNILQTDFHYYYDAAVRFSQDRTRLYLATDDYIAGFAYPPLAILPFLLLSQLPLGAALLCLTLASYAALVAAVWLWCRYLREHGLAIEARTARAVTIIALALGPTYMNAIFGQVNALVLLSCVSFLTLSAVRPVAAGVLLACGMWLKLYPIVMIAVGAWSRRTWRAIAFGGLAAVVLMAILLPIVPLSAHQAFLGDVLPARFDKTAIHVLNQSVVAFLERFRLPPRLYLQWSGEQAITVNATIRMINSGFAIAVLFYLWRRAKSGGRLSSVNSDAMLMALLAMVVPLGWGHTYMLALPLVILRLAQIGRAGPLRAFVIFCCVVALMVPAGRLFSFANDWPGWLQNLLYSRYLLATAILAILSTVSDTTSESAY
jgi:alpha-1,2-mannosyltransferase